MLACPNPFSSSPLPLLFSPFSSIILFIFQRVGFIVTPGKNINSSFEPSQRLDIEYSMRELKRVTLPALAIPLPPLPSLHVDAIPFTFADISRVVPPPCIFMRFQLFTDGITHVSTRK